jgi:hypothetical protein
MFKLPIDETKCYLPMHSSNCRASCLDNPCKYTNECKHYEEYSQICQHEFMSFDCEYWKHFTWFKNKMALTEFYDMKIDKDEDLTSKS